VDGVTYPTAEHWMMARKARLFGDDQALAVVLATEDPKAAKAAGRSVRGFDEQAWAAARFALVVPGNLAKFRSDPELGAFLAATRPRVLVEASPRDRMTNGFADGCQRPWGLSCLVLDFCEPGLYLVS
jgi:ribA/ribD-fused uncharacterized protein